MECHFFFLFKVSTGKLGIVQGNMPSSIAVISMSHVELAGSPFTPKDKLHSLLCKLML